LIYASYTLKPTPCVSCVQVLWDFEKATQFTFPWARQELRIIKDPPIGPPKAGDKLKVLEKASGMPLIELEVPPPPLVNAKSQSIAQASQSPASPAGPNTEIRPPSPGPSGPPGTGSGSSVVEQSEAMSRLKEFTR